MNRVADIGLSLRKQLTRCHVSSVVLSALHYYGVAIMALNWHVWTAPAASYQLGVVEAHLAHFHGGRLLQVGPRGVHNVQVVLLVTCG